MLLASCADPRAKTSMDARVVPLRSESGFSVLLKDSGMKQQTPPVESHRAAQELFDRTVDGYEARSRNIVFNSSSLIFARRHEVVLSLLDAAGASGLLLDFGMGPGVFAADVTRRGLHFVGIDIAEGMVERARSLGLENTTFVQGDLDSLDAYRQAADVVMSIGLIDYLEEPYEGLARLVDCLKPGGTFIVSFRVRRSLPTIMRDTAKVVWRISGGGSNRRSGKAFDSPVHEKSFSPRSDLIPALSKLHMKDFRVSYLNCSPIFFNIPVPEPLWHLWRAIDRRLAGRFTRWFCTAGVLSGRMAE